MAHAKGTILNLTFATQKIDKAISGLNGECFTPKEIHKITGVNRNTIGIVILGKTKKGLLEKVGYGCYKKFPDVSLAINLPSSFVSTKVWEILCQSEKPLTHREISKILAENTRLNLYSNIGVLLFNWYRNNVLDKIGGKRPYEYQITAGYKGKDRPVSSLSF